MSDLLSAASLFLAVIGLLYSVWYGEITKALALGVPKHQDDRGPAIDGTRTIYRTRALPLALASITLAVVLVPDLISVVGTTLNAIAREGVSAISLFDAVRALFCAVAVTSVSLAVHTSRLAWRVRSRWKELTS